MALQVFLSSGSGLHSPHHRLNIPKFLPAALSSDVFGVSVNPWAAQRAGVAERNKKRQKLGVCKIRSSLDTVVPVVGQVTEVNIDTFWPLVKGAGHKTVVVDMYTQWCGPCKVMAPKFEELSKKYGDVIFLKLDCNQQNKALAKELGIKVVPTFKLLKECKVVKEVTGAKLTELVLAIENLNSR